MSGHMEKVRLKYVADVNMGQSPPSSEYSEDPESGLPFLQGSAGFGPEHPSTNTYCATPNKTADKGDILFSVRAPVGAMNLADQSYGIGRGLCAIRAKGAVRPAFLWWSLHEARGALATETTGSTYEAVSVSDVANLAIAVPSPEEQRAIAADLDRETARIDALIEAKRDLLARLGEKRQALVARAVTRGLDPDAPRRDSGVPWLGEVPAHWEVMPFKRLMTGIEQGWSPQCENILAGPDEWGVLKVGAVNGGVFRPNEHKRLPDDLDPVEGYEVKPSDLLMSRANTTALVGSVAYVEKTRPRLMLCDKLYRIGVDEKRYLKRFVAYFFQSIPGRFVFERDSSGASNSMQNISQEAVRESLVPRPPLQEQEAIISHLETQLGKLATVSRTTRQSIDLLKERRASLISATVTGQRRVLQSV